jgi:hypothetical protein
MLPLHKVNFIISQLELILYFSYAKSTFFLCLLFTAHKRRETNLRKVFDIPKLSGLIYLQANVPYPLQFIPPVMG